MDSVSVRLKHTFAYLNEIRFNDNCMLKHLVLSATQYSQVIQIFDIFISDHRRNNFIV